MEDSNVDVSLKLVYKGVHPLCNGFPTYPVSEIKIQVGSKKPFIIGKNAENEECKIGAPEEIVDDHLVIENTEKDNNFECDIAIIDNSIHYPISLQLKPMEKFRLSEGDFIFLGPSIGVAILEYSTKSLSFLPNGWAHMNKIERGTLPTKHNLQLQPPFLKIKFFHANNFKLESEQNGISILYDKNKLKKSIVLNKSTLKKVIRPYSNSNLNDFKPNDLAPKHAEIKYDSKADSFYIQDLGSNKFGTFISLKNAMEIHNSLNSLSVPSSGLIELKKSYTYNICGQLFTLTDL